MDGSEVRVQFTVLRSISFKNRLSMVNFMYTGSMSGNYGANVESAQAILTSFIPVTSKGNEVLQNVRKTPFNAQNQL